MPSHRRPIRTSTWALGLGPWAYESTSVHKTVVLNVVGLTPGMLGPSMPRLTAWAKSQRVAKIAPAFPAVTCTAQADYLTGVFPNRHGIVGNGWYSREDCEVKFWKQSNKLVGAPKIWEAAKAADPSFTCANSSGGSTCTPPSDYSVTPRPIYRADGSKLPDIYSGARHAARSAHCQARRVPAVRLLGPARRDPIDEVDRRAAKEIETRFRPTLTLIYLPHLDYNLQRIGPCDPATRTTCALSTTSPAISSPSTKPAARTSSCCRSTDWSTCRGRCTSTACSASRAVAVREEMGGELLDAGASPAFAVADHQVAHVYINDPAVQARVRGRRGAAPGVERVLDRAQQAALGRGPRTRGRSRGGRRPRRLVHVLLLARRSPCARLRAHRRHPPQAGL